MLPRNINFLTHGRSVADLLSLYSSEQYSVHLLRISFSSVRYFSDLYLIVWGGRVVRWYWVSFQCRGLLLIWSRVGQGPTALAVGPGWGCFDIFSLVYHFSFLSPSLWETARYRLKYSLKGPLSPKQPTNQPILDSSRSAVDRAPDS